MVRMSWPSSSIAPASGRSMPTISFISVDLPAPFNPTRAWISLGRTVRSTSCTPAPPRYARDTPCRLNRGSVIVDLQHIEGAFDCGAERAPVGDGPADEPGHQGG